MKRMAAHALWVLVLLFLSSGGALATPPDVYVEPFHQSPTRVEPDHLLMIPGDGFDVLQAQVVYEAVQDTTIPPEVPAEIPEYSTAESGVMEVVKALEGSLTVRAPGILTRGQSYAVWVTNAALPGPSDWSDPVLLNDARPLWRSPATAFVSIGHPGHPGAESPRYLKIVGRNLQPAPGVAATKVRLTAGFSTRIVEAEVTGGVLDDYVAKIDLPANLCVDACDVRVEVSRDGGGSWVSMEPDYQLLPNPEPSEVLRTADITDCAAVCDLTDDLDDTACVECVLEYAGDQVLIEGGEVARAVVVEFQSGDWYLDERPSCTGNCNATIVPRGVSMSGDPMGWTTFHYRRPDDVVGKKAYAPSAFTFLGDNMVSNLYFYDDFAALAELTSGLPAGAAETGFLQLGKRSTTCEEQDPVANVVITNNIFRGMRVAIATSGASDLDRVTITNNSISAYSRGIKVGGCGHSDTEATLNVNDIIVAGNTLYPGAYHWPMVEGTMATAFSAGNRFDFSGNTSAGWDDWGTCDELPGGCGWRAAHFWFMGGLHENWLVSENTAYCTGSKTGEGEFMDFDQGGGQEPIFSSVLLPVNDPSPDSGAGFVLVDDAWNILDMVGGKDFLTTAEGGFWLSISKGPGLGQVRRMTGITEVGGEWRIDISPPWDVNPVPGESFVAGQRTYRHLYVVGNTVDNRECEKDNPFLKWAGGIRLYASVDGVIAGNRQWDSSGIWLNTRQEHDLEPPECGPDPPQPDCCDGSTSKPLVPSWSKDSNAGCGGRYCYHLCGRWQYFTDVRGNVLDGEYDFFEDLENPFQCSEDNNNYYEHCSRSGIAINYGVTLMTAERGMASYGLNISDNSVTMADDIRGGGIAFQQTGGEGGIDAELHRNALIQHNRISDNKRVNTDLGAGGQGGDDVCECLDVEHGGPGGTWSDHLDNGTGIHLHLNHTRHSVVYSNAIQATCFPILYNEEIGVDTVVLEPDSTGLPACAEQVECPRSKLDTCSSSDTGERACIKSTGEVFNCPFGETVHVRTCDCEQPVPLGCAWTQVQLTCAPDPAPSACPLVQECRIPPALPCTFTSIGSKECDLNGDTLSCNDEFIEEKRCWCFTEFGFGQVVTDLTCPTP